MTYSILTINEFCSGYMYFVQKCLNVSKPNVVKALDYICYLSDLLDEIPLVGWEGVRDAHGELLRQIEQGRIIWDDTRTINKAILRVAAEAAAANSSKGKTPSSASGKNSGPTKHPCPKYQDNSCEFASTHTADNMTWLHCCATCLWVCKQKYSHPKAICNRQKSMDDKPN